jgi:hypothetical protein
MAPESEDSSPYSQESATGPILSRLYPLYTSPTNLLFTRVRHRSLSWADCIHSTLPQPISYSQESATGPYPEPTISTLHSPNQSPIHKSPPPVPILSRLYPLYTPPTNLPKIHSDHILTSTSRSSNWYLFFGLYNFLPSVIAIQILVPLMWGHEVLMVWNIVA